MISILNLASSSKSWYKLYINVRTQYIYIYKWRNNINLITISDGRTDTGKDKEKGGNELCQVGLDGCDTEGITYASKCKLHHFFLIFFLSLCLSLFIKLDCTLIKLINSALYTDETGLCAIGTWARPGHGRVQMNF